MRRSDSAQVDESLYLKGGIRTKEARMDVDDSVDGRQETGGFST